MSILNVISKQRAQTDTLLRLLKDRLGPCSKSDGFDIRTLSHLESLRIVLNDNDCNPTTLFERLIQFIQEDAPIEREFANNDGDVLIVTLSHDAMISFGRDRLIDIPNKKEIFSFFESHEPKIAIEPAHQKGSLRFDTLYETFLGENDILNGYSSEKSLHRSQIEYNRLSVCFQQCIYALDLQISREVVQSLIELAISTIIGWCKQREKDDLNTMNVLKHLFDEKNFVLHGNQSSKLPFVLCTLDDNLTKSEDYVGITFRAEIMTHYDVRSKLHEHDSDIKSMLSQHFTIFVSSDGENITFKECYERFSEPQQLCLDGKQLIDLDPPVLKLSFERKRTNDACIELTSHISNQPLRTLIQTMKKTTEHRDTILLGWRATTESIEDSDWKSITYPTLIQFNSLISREVITSISCSSCHLLALTNVGSVYSCGKGSDGQLGINSRESISSLENISWFLSYHDKPIIISQIAAGGDESCSHSAAIDESGLLYTWGSALVCGHGVADKRQILCPRRVDSLQNVQVTSISCGNGFSLAIGFDRQESKEDSNHKSKIPFVFSWGKTSDGRLGHIQYNGTKNQESLYETYPTKITNLMGEYIVQISAGNAHALALTRNGDVFAWGSNAFGQCTADSLEYKNSVDYYQRRKDHFIIRNKKQESKQLCSDVWIPKKIHQLGPKQGKPVSKICAGGVQSACISNGSLYTWGGGGLNVLVNRKDQPDAYNLFHDYTTRNIFKLAGNLSLPSWTQPRRVFGLEKMEIVDVDLGLGHGMVLTKDDEVLMFRQCSMNIDSIPINPNCNDFHHIRGKAISKISCGGPLSFCISSGDLAAAQIGKNLYNNTLDNAFQRDKTSIDCNIVTCGKRIPCHKIILAMRSSTFNDLLRGISRSKLATTSVTDLFITNEHYEVVKDLIAFIYKDSIADLNTSSLSSTLSLYKIATRFKVWGLVQKCKQILKDDFGYFDSSEDAGEGTITTFATDLSNALTDDTFFDVKFICADDSTLTAHTCILRSRGIYFDHYFHTSSSDSDFAIRVPFSFGSLQRILFYIYTCRLKEKSAQCELIEDISNAHFINLASMVKQCESELEILPENAIQIFSLSLKIKSSALRQRSMHVIVKSLAQQEYLDQFLNTVPSDVKDEFFDMIKDHVGIGSIIPRERRDDAINLLQREMRYKREMNDSITSTTSKGFTLSKLFILLLVVITTVNTIQMRYSLWIIGPIVPMMNTITIILILVYLTLSIM